MKRVTVKCAALAALACVAIAYSPRTASAELLYNPVVSVVGDGTNAISSAGFSVSVELFNNSVAGGPVSTATYASGATSPRLVDSGSATSDAMLTNNPGVANGAAQGVRYAGSVYAYSSGYDATDNTAGIVASTAPRVVGAVTMAAASITNPTVLASAASGQYTANNIRCAVGGDDGGATTPLYTAGTGTPATSGGWRNFTSPAGTGTQLETTVTNTRTVEELGNQLFGSTGSGSTVGIYKIDPTGVTPATTFVTTGTSTDHSPYGFALFDLGTSTVNPGVSINQTQNGYNVAYIADDKSPSGDTNGGIEKWHYTGSTWTQDYILKDTSTTYYRGLAGQLDADTGLVTLLQRPTLLPLISCSRLPIAAAGSTFTTLDTAPTNYILRGVALDPVAAAPSPEPSSLALMVALGVAGLFGFAWRRRSAR